MNEITMTAEERKAIINEIIDLLVELGACEPRTEEERLRVEARRAQIGAERFDRDTRSIIEFANDLIITEGGEAI